ncbi:GntR family transcriptional regulator [Eubacterium oxidoreducens]|uniref:DNA-binding transcriptional regulator YhcF, GntR family n=1 Tax=Eubacterium oxidoreducens TaxID=1732 RepID=A0A1G6BCA1_EUBOX|nr:GntR family transcriptional regulator [Eubacterium oxidoreducens]SDB18223.1 DNA-binding transcriptional regulator YhcF, GntR family [Eubacterium oxidoreducens]
MAWNLDNNRAIYLQLMNEIERRIIKGQYLPGTRLDSVRELAAEAGVNPNTMQKALAELERSGLVYSQRTSGRFVTDDGERIERMRSDMAKRAAKEFLKHMRELGFSAEEIKQILDAVEEEG